MKPDPSVERHSFCSTLAAVMTVVLLMCSCGGGSPLYKDSSKSTDARTKDLLSRMTVEEKIGQIVCPLGWPMYSKEMTPGGPVVDITDQFRDFMDNQHGGMLWAVFRADPWTQKTIENGLDPVLSAKVYNAMQRYAIDSTRLGIPIILAEEAPHGHMAIGTTVFPTSIGLASSWDEPLMEEVGRVIAKELRAQGAHIGYGPVVDLAREPRWSRVEETYGEDVYLTSSMASAMMRGTSPKHNGYDKGIASTLKHFVAYGIPEGGHNGNPSFVGERDLRENFLPVFKRATEEGALSVMTSYNAIDGIPSTASRHLLSDVLRDEWGFDGTVVSDLQSIDGLYHTHHIATSRKEAGELALKAGVDVDLGANCFSLLKESLEEGRISIKDIDKAVSRVLKLKFDIGLFDNPYIDESAVQNQVRTPENLSVSLKAALESVTLLENNGILPLKKGTKVAVIGPNADNVYNQLGDYTAPQRRDAVVTMLDGIRSIAGEGNVRYAKGCAVRDPKDTDFPAARSAALWSDVIVAVVGGSSARDFRTSYEDTGAAVVDNGISDMEAGEGFDRSTLSLMGDQLDLLKMLKSTGKPLIVVHIEGRPLEKNWAKENADALLTLWYPGGEGGNALAKVLWGEYNPAGRLPISVPVSLGQIPVYYNRRNPWGHDYVEIPSAPLYEFGYGKSYTSFSYSDLSVEKTGEESASLSFVVTNTGDYDGDEVVQVYIRDEKASTVRPVKQLCAFRRVNIPKGESVRLEFSLGREAFLMYDAQMEPVVEKGDFRIMVGASSSDIRLEDTLTL